MAEIPERLVAALADRYRLEGELGQGGMAAVYLAEDLRHRRQVAIKVLRPELSESVGAERFQREIEIAARLQHPHIVPLLDSGETAGFLYYVMPYVEGESLRTRLAREGALPIADAVRILRDIVDALTEAHAHGVVHRDLKPENILLRGRHALVADFGVARALTEARGPQTLTTAGVALGTPAYMAPEQAAADPHLDHRVDIYATGVVAYEMLAGRPVFMGTNPQMVLAAHVSEAPVPIGRYREAVPPALERLVMRCLEKNAADRWQSAAELLALLEALVTPSGGVTPFETRPVRGVSRRRRRWLAAAAVSILAIIALAAAGVRRLVGLRTHGEPTNRELATPGDAFLPIISPDGSQVAYRTQVCSRLAGCVYELVVRDLATDAEQVVARDTIPLTPMRFSPDGARILFTTIAFSATGPPSESAYLVARLGGAARQLLGPADSLKGIDFLPGGDSILAQAGHSLRTMLTETGEVVRVVPLPPDFGGWLSGVSGDGRWLAFDRFPMRFDSTSTGLTSFGTNLLVTDRSVQVLDSLSVPLTSHSARWVGVRTLVALAEAPLIHTGGGTAAQGPSERALLRWKVNSRTGRAGRPDTVLMTAFPPGFSADGRSLVMNGPSRIVTTVWTYEPGDSMLRPLREVESFGSTGGVLLDAAIAADGRSLTYRGVTAGNLRTGYQYYTQAFSGGKARAMTPYIPVAEFLDHALAGYGDWLYVATRSGRAPGRITRYSIATGQASAFAELPNPRGPLQIALVARPGGGLLWHEPGAWRDTLHVLDGAGHTIAVLPDPVEAERAPDGWPLTTLKAVAFSPDAAELALAYEHETQGTFSVTLYALTIADRRLRPVSRAPLAHVLLMNSNSRLQWTSDNWIRIEMAVPADPRPGVYHVRPQGGSLEREHLSPFNKFCRCTVSNDGRRWVGVTTSEIRSELVLLRNFNRLR